MTNHPKNNPLHKLDYDAIQGLLNVVDARLKTLEEAVYPCYGIKMDSDTYTAPIMRATYTALNQWILVQGDEYTSRELAMLYCGYITSYDKLNLLSYDDLCVIVKFVESYLENITVRKFTKVDNVFSNIKMYIFLHFDLVGETYISPSDLASLISVEKQTKK